MLKKIFLLILFIGILASCNLVDRTKNEEKTEIVISAASSLTEAISELEQNFEAENPDIDLTLNFASSGKLAYQIEHGAPVDIFLSASTYFMDQVENANLIDKESRFSFASNEMVLVANTKSLHSITSFEQLDVEKINLIAIGNPDSVPAGEYTKEILQHLSLWDSIKNKIVYAKDVRQVIAYVESGNVDYGVVYLTDAINSDNVSVVATASSSWHDYIEYPAAIVKESNNKAEAKLFLDYLNSNEAKVILHKYGFK